MPQIDEHENEKWKGYLIRQQQQPVQDINDRNLRNSFIIYHKLFRDLRKFHSILYSINGPIEWVFLLSFITFINIDWYLFMNKTKIRFFLRYPFYCWKTQELLEMHKSLVWATFRFRNFWIYIHVYIFFVWIEMPKILIFSSDNANNNKFENERDQHETPDLLDIWNMCNECPSNGSLWMNTENLGKFK